MDSAQRRRMSAELLEGLLFIRANWLILKEIVEREADKTRAAKETAKIDALYGRIRENREAAKKALAIVVESTLKHTGGNASRAAIDDDDEAQLSFNDESEASTSTKSAAGGGSSSSSSSSLPSVPEKRRRTEDFSD